MKVSKLITILQKAQQEYGDLPIHYTAHQSEYSPSTVVLARAGSNPANIGAVTGPHQSEPDRLVINGNNLW